MARNPLGSYSLETACGANCCMAWDQDRQPLWAVFWLKKEVSDFVMENASHALDA